MDVAELARTATNAIRLPVVLDDDEVEACRAVLTALAVDPGVAHVVLDAVGLESVSAKGLGLLAGVRLTAARRGAGLCVIRCTSAMAATLSLARLRICDVDDCDVSLHRSCPPTPAEDWTPWWTGAAANA